MNKLTQPKGSVAIETNKNAIARIFQIKDVDVGYLKINDDISNYKILYDNNTQTVWNKGNAIGMPINWEINSDDNLILNTNVGNYILSPAYVGSENILYENNNGFSGNVENYLNISITYLTPEMFGAKGDGISDDSAAIIAACNLARQLRLNKVIGNKTYAISQSIPCTTGRDTQYSTGAPLFGFELYLNRVVIHDSWPELSTDWWNCNPAFYSAGVYQGTSASCENFRLHVNEFFGKLKAHFFEVKGGGLSTSHIHCNTTRQHIIGYKCIGVSQSTMNNITGHLWQTGYIAAIVGGSLNGVGGGNCEAHTFDIQWCATNRYGAIILADGSRYSAIRGGTYDYNGQYTSMLLLNNLSTGDAMANETANRWVFEPWKTVYSQDGLKTSTSLSQIMWFNGAWYLHVTENQSVTNGTSKWSVGETINNGSGFTATISNIILPSSDTSIARYWDIIMCQRLAGFSKCKLDAEYVGGYVMHYDFTNDIWAPHPVSGRRMSAYRGLGIAGTYNHLYLYANQLSYGPTAFMDVNEEGITVTQPLILNTQRLRGNVVTQSIPLNTATNVMTFVASESDTNRRHHLLLITSSNTSQCGMIEVFVGTTSITVKNVNTSDIVFSSTGLTLRFTLGGSAGVVTINALRV